MPYRAVFVGMVCFFKKNGTRIAMLPNGLNEDPPHVTKISISDPDDILDKSSNWGNNFRPEGDFLITQPCEIHLEKASESNPNKPLEILDPQPVPLAAGFTINPATAKTIARVPIMQGTLQSFRFPGTDPSTRASVITHLDVPHDARIHIEIVSNSGTVRTIDLKRRTEIAIINDTTEKNKEHFHLYQKLGTGTNLGTETPPVPNHTKYKRSDSKHRIFKKNDPIVDGVNCPNTGCCGG